MRNAVSAAKPNASSLSGSCFNAASNLTNACRSLTARNSALPWAIKSAADASRLSCEAVWPSGGLEFNGACAATGTAQRQRHRTIVAEDALIGFIFFDGLWLQTLRHLLLILAGG